MTPTGRYPGFRAPQGDGEILCVPAASELPALVARNRQRPEFAVAEWFGHPLTKIARELRREVFRAAIAHTSRYATISGVSNPDAPLIVTGHQADLFHPGVWLKNFSAARLARECGGTALNLIIDSDLCRATVIRVPTGVGDALHFEMVPFDKAMIDMPYEERRIADREQWTSFGRRVARALTSLVSEPLINDWWPTVVEAGQADQNVGQALSVARHQCELDWGMCSLELPQSQVCQTEGFRLFVLQLFERAAEFREVHNQALYEYRAAHKLKNHAQPMPNLADKDGWIEAPFWLWSVADPHRRGVFVKRVGQEIVVSDLGALSLSLPADPALAVEKLADWESHGVKLRTRALATTLFARLLLADVFIHGIGGAKYDQVTDHICELLYGFSLPPYATVSGTLRLPLAAGPAACVSERDLRQELRNMRFHPERFREHMVVPARETGKVEDLIGRKRAWIETPKTPANASERHHGIHDTNVRLQPYFHARRVALEEGIGAARLAATARQLRDSREYAYCLFPAEQLREFLID